MKFIVNIFLISIFFPLVLFLFSCSDSDNTLDRLSDTIKKKDVYDNNDILEEDYLILADIGEEDIETDYGSIDIVLSDSDRDIIEVSDVPNKDVNPTDIIYDIGDAAIERDIISVDIFEDIKNDIVEYPDILSDIQCQSICTKGQKRCKDSSTLEICDDFDSDGCYEYGFYKSCDSGCVNDDCLPGCQEIQLTEIEPVVPSESIGGRYETTQINGFNDDYLYNKTNYTKIGIRREWGGTIIFFGLDNGKAGVNSSNTIDANDTGREVQVAFYDPDRAMQNCAYNAGCASTQSSCPNSITFLGWDPVQGGNRCNIGSGVESVNYANGILSVSLVPLFWNPDWDRSDCDSSGCSDPNNKNRKSDVRVIQNMRFITQHVVELEYTVINLSNVEHRATAQEMPTMYTANGKDGTQDLYKLFDSQGNIVPIDQPAGGDGFNYKNFQSPDGWVAMQNDNVNYGVGIYYENRVKDFQGWQLRSLPFNNVRAIFVFGIPASGTVRARAYLSLGNYGTIRSEFTDLDSKLGPFGSLDLPANDAEVLVSLNIGGWAMDNKGIVSVYAVIDNSINVPLTYGADRPDVCKVWPGYSACSDNKVGYNGSYDVTTLSKCPHLIEIYAVDTDNNKRRIASKRFIVK